jgi:uncharacterized ferritin-like protein (DUF455 family)
MQKFLQKEQLAREEHILYIPGAKIFEIRAEQGLPQLALPTTEDPAARVAGVNRGLEGLACDVFAQLVQLAQKLGDPIIERAVDMVLADEITHVRMGSTWMRKLTEDDPARRQMALDFQHHIDELFNFGGARQDGPADQVAISISREARKMAGFTDEEIDRLVKAASASVAY